jgi:tetratricopeptide (TPR) repeat protein
MLKRANCTAKLMLWFVDFVVAAAAFAPASAYAQDPPAELILLQGRTRILAEESRRNPENLHIQIMLAEAQMRSGDLTSAKSTLKSLVDRHPGFVPAVTSLGQIHRRMFEYRDALQLLDKAVALAPRDSAVRVLAADIALERMDFSTASALYETMLKENPRSPLALHGLASVAYWENRYDDADRLARECLKVDSGFARAWLLMSFLHRIRQENPEWAACGRKAVASDPLDDEARANYFNILIRGEQKAAEGYDQARIALKLNPYNLTAHNYIGNGWSARTYPPPALPLSGGERNHFLEIMAIADSSLATHDIKSASRAYDLSLGLLPEYIPALIGKGAALYYMVNYDEALHYFLKVLDIDPDYGLAHYGVAMCLLRRRDAVNIELERLRGTRSTDTPEPPALRDVFTNYTRLDPEMQRIIRSSVKPLRAYLPALKREKVTFLIFPFHHFLWQVPFNKKLQGKKTFDGRLWDDVKGSGGNNACAGEEWERDVKNFRFNVLTHEFAHQVHGFLPKDLRKEITRLYTSAKKARKTLDFYSDANENEYFAVGVEAYVSEYKLADQKITYGHTRSELLRVDPDLHGFIARLNQLASSKKTK